MCITQKKIISIYSIRRIFFYMYIRWHSLINRRCNPNLKALLHVSLAVLSTHFRFTNEWCRTLSVITNPRIKHAEYSRREWGGKAVREGHKRNYYLGLLYGEKVSLHQCYTNCTLVCHAFVKIPPLDAFVTWQGTFRYSGKLEMRDISAKKI